MMKRHVLLVVFAIAGVVQAEAKAQIPYRSYHEEVGIPLAQEIYKAEKEMHEKGMIDNVNSRIVAGRNSSIIDHPYFGGLLIQLRNNLESVCGSCLLTTTRTLTAGHCWNDGTYNALKVIIVHASNTLYYGGTRIESSTAVVHEHFDYPTLTNDLTMIYHPAVQTSNLIRPIALPRGMSKNTFAGMKAVAVGYGRISSYKWGNIIWGQTRREVTVKILSNSVCSQYFAGITNKKLCTVGVRNAVGICQGDSGGPLVVSINGVHNLAGDTSFSMLRCDGFPYYSGFTRITEYIDWIDDKLR